MITGFVGFIYFKSLFIKILLVWISGYVGGLWRENRCPSALAIQLHLLCLEPSICQSYVYDIRYVVVMNMASRGCFTTFLRVLQNNIVKIHNARNHTSCDNFKLKLCTCAQRMALGTRTKFQLKILTRSKMSSIRTFQENISESSRDVSEKPTAFRESGVWNACKLVWTYMFFKNCWICYCI